MQLTCLWFLFSKGAANPLPKHTPRTAKIIAASRYMSGRQFYYTKIHTQIVRVTEPLTPDCGVTVLVQPISYLLEVPTLLTEVRDRIKQELLILVVGCDPQVRRTNS